MAAKIARSNGSVISRISCCVAVAVLLIGCSRTGSEGPKSGTVETAAGEATPDKDHQRCFACDERGVMACKAGCAAGQVECPGPCLKLTRGKWEHLEVAGHPPTDLWQKFPDGQGGWTAWTQGHVGEVIVVQNGKAANI